MSRLEPLVLDGFVPYPQDVAARYRREGHWTDQTLAEMFFETAGRLPRKTAVIAGGTRLSYAELAERVLRIGAGLRDLGLRRGDRVVVQLPNVPDFVAIVLALYDSGIIPVFALPAHRRSEIEYFVEFAGARAYITVDAHEGTDLGALAAELRGSSPTLEHTIVLSPGGGGDDVEGLLAHEPLPRERRTLSSDVALLQLSGGTTGRPKLIPHTHETYLYAVRHGVRACDVTEATVQLVVLPISHSYAMRSPGWLGAFHAGGTIVIAPNGSPDVTFPLIEQHRATEASLVPPIALAWLNSSLKDQYDLTSLQVLHVGGAKFSAEAARRVEPELGVALQQGFGMSEGLVTYNALDADEKTKAVRQGRPTSTADEIRILDDDDREVPVGAPGHLLTRGPSTIRGYYRAPDHNARSFTAEGFYRTGDIVEQDQRGFLTVVGRSKDQINRGGEKIAPEEVENLILAHEAVHNVSVVGIPDEVLGERAKAYIIAREGAEARVLNLAGIRAFLRERGLAAYKLPDVVEVVETFPNTAVGKVSKRAQRSA